MSVIVRAKSKKIQIGVIFILTVMVLCGCQNGGDIMEEKSIMEQYLEDKYGKQFVVEKIDYYRQQLGDDKRIKAVVYPEDDHDLKFEVKKILDDKEWAFTGSAYSERYLNLLWEKQMKEKVMQEFGSEIIEVGISAPILEIEKDVSGRTIDINEALELYENKISMHIACGYLIDGNFEFDSSWIEKLYSSIKAIKNGNFEKIELVVRFFNEENKEDVNKDPSRYLKAFASEYRDLKQKDIIRFNMEIGDLTDIEQPSDLQKYIE